MNFCCEKEKINKAIASVVRGASIKTTLPVLEGILIEAKNNTLKLTTYDLEIGIEYILECNVKEEGKTVVNAIMFSEIIRKLPDTDINISINENGLLVIECEGSLYKLATMDYNEFPELPKFDIEKSIEIKENVLKEMIKKTVFAVSMEENRPILTGCLFEITENKLSIVAVDGFRLALRNSYLEQNYQDFKAVIPGRTLNEINRIMTGKEENIKIGISKNQALFNLENCVIVARLLEGEFLNYENTIPKTKLTRIKANKPLLQEAFERASLLSMSSLEKEKKYPVKVNVDLDKIIISCASQTGNAKEEMFIELEGENLEIGFNPKYMLDALKNIDDEEIFIDFNGNLSPAVIRPTLGDRYIYLILPIKLKD